MLHTFNEEIKINLRFSYLKKITEIDIRGL